MRTVSFHLSEKDRTLITSLRRISHPLEFAPLLPRIPEDHSGAQALAAYEVARDDPRGWAGCAECQRDENHLRGLVLQFPDGSRAALGRICGETKHALKHGQLIEEFDRETERSAVIRRLLSAIEQLTPISEFSLTLLVSPGVVQLLTARRELENRCRKLYENLRSSPKGRLYLEKTVQDDDAMIRRRNQRDDLADRYIKRIQDRTGVEPDRASVEAHFRENEFFSTTRLTKQELRQAATFVGSFLFNGMGNLERDLTDVARSLHNALAPLDGKSSEEFSTSMLRACARDFVCAVKNLVDLVEGINEAAKFFALGNLVEVLGWANQHPGVRGAGTYRLGGGILSHEFQSGPPQRVTIPGNFEPISTNQLVAALRAVDGEDGAAKSSPEGAAE